MSTLKVENIQNLAGEDKFTRKFVATLNPSGTNLAETSIPTWANEIVITCSDIGTSIASGNVAVRIGQNTVETTGYKGTQSSISTSSVSSAIFSAYWAPIPFDATSNLTSGEIRIKRHSSNKWVIASQVGRTGTAYTILFSGEKNIVGELNLLQLSHTTGNFAGGASFVVTAME